MDRNVLFLCNSDKQTLATKKMLENKNESVYWGEGSGFPDFPLVAWDGFMWVGYVYPCRTVTRWVEAGRKLIDLDEHTARGGY